jgi:hypothetical protein
VIGSVGKRKKTELLVPFGDGIVLVPGGGLIRNYRLVAFFRGRAVEVDFGSFNGLRVPSKAGSAIFVGDSYDISGLAYPPNRFLVTRAGTHVWVAEPEQGDVVQYRQIQNFIIKESKMSYATGKADSADFKSFDVQQSSWTAQPIKGLPIQLDNGAPAFANCQDEVIYGIVHAVTTYTQNENIGGVDTDVDYYNITVQIAEGDVDINHGFASETYGKPLFVQDYTFGGTTSLNDIWSTELPSSGFSHPMCLVNDAGSLHYNGIVRPAVI